MSKKTDLPLMLFQFRAINPQGEGLQGAEFTLYRIYKEGMEDEYCKKYKIATANKDGLVYFGCIPFYNFVMLQTVTPEGYGENEHPYHVSANLDVVMIDCFPEEWGGHTIVNIPKESCKQPPEMQAAPRSSHNAPVRNPRQIFDSLNTSGTQLSMKGNDSLPDDFQRPNLLTPKSKWFCHVQGFGVYGSNLIASHNGNKERRFGYFVTAKAGSTLGHHYDAYYEVPDDNRKFNHTGGFQIIGDYLAIGIETPDYGNSIIALYDLKEINPACDESHAAPQFKRLLRGVKADNCLAVGITDFKIMQNGVEQSYFLMVTHESSGANGSRLLFYIAQGNDLLTANFRYISTYHGNVKDYQGMSLITEDIGNGHDYANFYIVAPFTTDVAGIPTHDYCDLYRVALSGDFEVNPNYSIAKVVDGKHFYTHGGASTLGRKVHFRWGSGVEITNGDNFRLHTTERNFSRGKTFGLTYNTFAK